jgi:hypothetical protein
MTLPHKQIAFPPPDKFYKFLRAPRHPRHTRCPNTRLTYKRARNSGPPAVPPTIRPQKILPSIRTKKISTIPTGLRTAARLARRDGFLRLDWRDAVTWHGAASSREGLARRDWFPRSRLKMGNGGVADGP